MTRAISSDPLVLRRWALWILLAGHLLAGWGVQWDLQWHIKIGRDSAWIAPHLMIYVGIALCALTALGVLAWETYDARCRISGPCGRIRVLGVAATRGFHLTAHGVALVLLAAPIDDLWHRLFGIDVTLWSPPHLLGFFGTALNATGCLLIAGEVYPARSIRGLVATVAASAQIYATLHVILTPCILFAYQYRSWFYGYAIAAALVLPVALIPPAMLSRRRAAPLLIVIAFVGLGVAGGGIARGGFAWLRPEPYVRTEALDTLRSPIGMMQAIMQNGRPANGAAAAGESCSNCNLGIHGANVLGVPGGAAILAAATMAIIDPRRFPVLASVGYALAFFGMFGWVQLSRPAFRPLLPGALDTVPMLAVTLLFAMIGGLLARSLAHGLDRRADQNVARHRVPADAVMFPKAPPMNA